MRGRRSITHEASTPNPTTPSLPPALNYTADEHVTSSTDEHVINVINIVYFYILFLLPFFYLLLLLSLTRGDCCVIIELVFFLLFVVVFLVVVVCFFFTSLLPSSSFPHRRRRSFPATTMTMITSGFRSFVRPTLFPTIS